MTGRGLDKRGYSWPPFEVGNTAALTVGARSSRVVDPLAAQLVEAAMAKAPWLLDSDTAAVRAWAIAETRAGLYADALARHQEDRAVPCAGCETCLPWDTALARWQTTAANHRIRLGLDPLSRAQLGKDVTQAALNTSRASGTVDAQIAAEIAALESELGIPSGAGRYVVNDHLSDLIDADSEEREP